jgi:hypothetical protein
MSSDSTRVSIIIGTNQCDLHTVASLCFLYYRSYSLNEELEPSQSGQHLWLTVARNPEAFLIIGLA